MIAVSIYSYQIKCWVKQKHLSPFHVKNDKLTKWIINMDSNVDINVLVDTKSYENILVYNILKLRLMLSLCVLSSIK